MSPERVRIVLVEDNAADVYLFRKALKAAGLDYELTVIDNGADAIAFFQDQGSHAGGAPPDLALLDLNLPKKDGIEVLRVIRRNERFADIPVVITSSSRLCPSQAADEQLEVTRYIPKPPNLDDFLRIGESVKDVLLHRKTRSSAS